MEKIKFIATIVGVVILSVVLTLVVTSKNTEISDVDKVMASDLSSSQKAIYLQDRYSDETAKWEILSKHSDLCSNKYLNELSTLEDKMEATIIGYKELKNQVDVSKYKELSKQISDYEIRYDEYKKLVEKINKEEYESAIKNLDKIVELDKQEYQNIEKEISTIGN